MCKHLFYTNIEHSFTLHFSKKESFNHHKITNLEQGFNIAASITQLYINNWNNKMKSTMLLIIGLVSTINIISSQTICDCGSQPQTVCCNGMDYSNTCFAKCNNCTDDQISDGPC